MARAFLIHPSDNVATLLEEASGTVRVVGPSPQEIVLGESIGASHKVAVCAIAAGGPVIKYGVVIGHATQPIARGAWVHLHNLRSALDDRSSTLDLHTGAPTDTSAAYV
jgi:hypothetical protein